MEFLPKPEVVSCYFAQDDDPPIPAMKLRWNADALGTAERTWFFPQKVCVNGPAPEKFGIVLHRIDLDQYVLKVLWNHMFFCWNGLTRVQILASSLTPILRSLGTDLWYLLNQPITSEMAYPAKAAG